SVPHHTSSGAWSTQWPAVSTHSGWTRIPEQTTVPPLARATTGSPAAPSSTPPTMSGIAGDTVASQAHIAAPFPKIARRGTWLVSRGPMSPLLLLTACTGTPPADEDVDPVALLSEPGPYAVGYRVESVSWTEDGLQDEPRTDRLAVWFPTD